MELDELINIKSFNITINGNYLFTNIKYCIIFIILEKDRK